MTETMSFRHFETGLRIKVINFIIVQLPVYDVTKRFIGDKAEGYHPFPSRTRS